MTKLLGLRNWLNELVLFLGHTRLLPVYVWLIQVFLGLLLVRIGRQTFAYIVLSCEKGMTVMDQMLTAVLFSLLLQMGLCQARLFDCFLFLCSLVACVSAALSLSSLTDSKYSSSDVISLE